jgi:hypothetical protein
MNVRPLGYGETKPSSNVEGIELLEEWERKQSENPEEQGNRDLVK